MLKDLSEIAEFMKVKIEENPDKIIESPPLSKVRAEKLRDDYLVNYNVIGIEPINSTALDCSTYILIVTQGDKKENA